jgi:predicted GTPase
VDDVSKDVIKEDIRQQDAAIKTFCRCAEEVLEELERVTEDGVFSELSTQRTLLDEQLKRLQANEKSPFSIVLVGVRGHGKSTLMNALLDEASCIPSDNIDSDAGTGVYERYCMMNV